MSGNTIEDNYEDKENEVKTNEESMRRIEEEARERVIHIYINENTDAIIRHRGKVFELKPPLRYAGTEGGGLHMYERNTIAYLEAHNKQLRQEIDDLADGVHSDNSWITTALSEWTANAEKSDGLCTPRQNDNNRNACIAECDGNAPAGVLHACYSSFVPRFATPYFSRPYLYPPGHPESDLKKGL